MQGSIYKRILKDGSPRYYAVYRNPAGKQKTKTFQRRKDAERFLTNSVKTVQDGTYTAVKPLVMNEVFDNWLADLDVRLKKGEVKPSTAKSYRAMLRTHLRPAFKDYPSNRFGHEAVAEWIKTLADRIAAGRIERADGEDQIKAMAPKTYNNLLNLLHAILAWARHHAQSYLAHDPLVGQKRLPKQAAERDFLEPDEIEKLLRAAAPPDDTIIHVSVYSGLRRGELFGLQWRDVECGNGTDGGRLRIRRSLYQGALTAPKTPNSIRMVDVSQRTLDELAMYRLGFPALDGDFIFRQSSGRPIDPDNWTKDAFLPTVEKAEIKRVTLHCLRHTYASLLINANESIKYVSRQLGHASIQITADLYGHLFRETSVAAMKRLGQQIPSNKKLTDQAKTAENSVEHRGNGRSLNAEQEKA